MTRPAALVARLGIGAYMNSSPGCGVFTARAAATAREQIGKLAAGQGAADERSEPATITCSLTSPVAFVPLESIPGHG